MRNRAVVLFALSARFRSPRGMYAVVAIWGALGCLFFVACQSVTLFDINSDDPAGQGASPWRDAFDYRDAGVLSGVWGSAPNDVFIVGGTFDQGEVRHFDGKSWHKTLLPDTPLLIWVFGFGPNDVYAVGVEGTLVHYDGRSWRSAETGVDVGLWGIWGSKPDDIWIVGGDVGQGSPVILHYDGVDFVTIAIPDNDRGATALFKVWGIGSKVFAVGEHGLILQFEGGDWFQVPAGAAADDDFVSLWGSSEDRIVAVGGRGAARIARYDGSIWTTEKFGQTPGLSAVHMTDAQETLVGGINGYLGTFDSLSRSLAAEATPTLESIHAIWGDGQGTFYAVGGRFSEPFAGIALVRSENEPGSETTVRRGRESKESEGVVVSRDVRGGFADSRDDSPIFVERSGR